MKLLFFDIDGTLIDSAHFHFDIPEEVLKELKRVQAQGHKLFIASGRPAPLVDPRTFLIDKDRIIDYILL